MPEACVTSSSDAVSTANGILPTGSGLFSRLAKRSVFARGLQLWQVGSDGAQRALGAPLENPLFFAGEATDDSGHKGTVHGAIASGYRAAEESLQRLG
jgi:Flavin containing amine oxidoreductase